MAKTTDSVLHRRQILESCWNVFNVPPCPEHCGPCLSTPSQLPVWNPWKRRSAAFPRKWLGLPRSLTSSALYGTSNTPLLPFRGPTEEYKVAPTREVLEYRGSRDREVSRACTEVRIRGKKKSAGVVEERVSRVVRNTVPPPLLRKRVLRTSPHELPESPGWPSLSLKRKTPSCPEEGDPLHQGWREATGTSTDSGGPLPHGPRLAAAGRPGTTATVPPAHSNNIPPARHDRHLRGFKTCDHARTDSTLGRVDRRGQQEETYVHSTRKCRGEGWKT